jgi:hypothetical protein
MNKSYVEYIRLCFYVAWSLTVILKMITSQPTNTCLLCRQICFRIVTNEEGLWLHLCANFLGYKNVGLQINNKIVEQWRARNCRTSTFTVKSSRVICCVSMECTSDVSETVSVSITHPWSYRPILTCVIAREDLSEFSCCKSFKSYTVRICMMTSHRITFAPRELV